MRVTLAGEGYGYDPDGRLYVRLADGTWREGHTLAERSNIDFIDYVKAVGHEPPVPAPDDPLGWQWDTKMTRKEQRRRLGL